MENTESYLITLSNGEFLIKVALKVHNEELKGDAREYSLEPENKKQFSKLLPLHCKSFGEIVEVEQIFEVIDKSHP